MTPTASNYAQSPFNIRHYQVNGDLAVFAQKVSRVALDAATLLAQELMRSAVAMRWLRTVTNLYGSAGATPDIKQTPSNGMYRPQWDGIDRQINANSVLTPVNGLSGALTLRDLDNVIDVITQGIAGEISNDDFFLAMSRPAISSTDRLLFANQRGLTNSVMAPRRDDGQVGSPVVTLPGGIEVESYRGVPILPTSFTRPGATGSIVQMSTVTAAVTGTGGSLGTAALFYQIVPITQYGPLYASAEATATPASGNILNLTFSTPVPTDNFGNVVPVIQYQVYKSGTTGTESLYGIVGATDAADAPVTTIRDDGTQLIANPGANQFTVGAGSNAYFGSGTNNSLGDTVNKCWVPSAGFSVERIYCMSRNPDFVVVPTVTDMESQILAPTNIRSIQYAVAGDCALALRASGFAAVVQALKMT